MSFPLYYFIIFFTTTVNLIITKFVFAHFPRFAYYVYIIVLLLQSYNYVLRRWNIPLSRRLKHGHGWIPPFAISSNRNHIIILLHPHAPCYDRRSSHIVGKKRHRIIYYIIIPTVHRHKIRRIFSLESGCGGVSGGGLIRLLLCIFFFLGVVLSW